MSMPTCMILGCHRTAEPPNYSYCFDHVPAQVDMETTPPRDHVGIAREYLAKAQSIAEFDLGHALFTMGAALNHTLHALEGHQHGYHIHEPSRDIRGDTGTAWPVEESLNE